MFKKSSPCIVLIQLTAALPLLWCVGVVAFAIRAQWYLGYWPAANHPDPQFLPFEWHHFILFFLTYGVIFSLVLLPSLRLLLGPRISKLHWKNAQRIFGAGWVSILVLAFVPPINFVAWFLD